jgi:plastocyanin
MGRIRHFIIACCASYVLVAQAESAIEGVVRLPSPAAIAITPSRYQNITPGEVGSPEPPLAVVYLEGSFPAPANTNTPMARMEQHHYQFSPGLLPIRTGTAVEFPNLDDGYHNVFSYSKPKRFDLGRYRKDEKPPTLVFDKAGVIKLYCEIHEHMRGTILVLDTPFFVKTDAAGKYRLEHLPIGKFTLKAWVDDKTTRERPVELSDGARLRVDFPGK